MTAYIRMLRISWKDPMHDCWMTYSKENSGTLGMWWEQTISASPSFTAVLQAQGNVEDHEDAVQTTSKDWTELAVAECMRTALQDRTAWSA